jgi:hypothetical protein
MSDYFGSELFDPSLFHKNAELTGEAVDLHVIYPAQYGSPDLFSDGLY